MFKIFKNNTGATLITVIIITTVLLLLGSVLVDASLKGLTLTKMDRNIDFTYYAAHTAIENWFSVIEKVASDESKIEQLITSNGRPSEGDSGLVLAFVNALIAEINGNLNKGQYIDILSNNDDLDNVQGQPYSDSVSVVGISEVRLDGVQLMAAPEFSGETLTITLGLTVNALLKDGFYTADNKTVFAQKEFTFTIPERRTFELEYAILTLGDLYANGMNRGDLIGNVKGDVNVFGTFPRVQEDPRQHFYGGIYAINDAMLNLMGNAYTRSFIRTGPYYPRALYGTNTSYYGGHLEDGRKKDGSKIHIFKDAIAQCIQIFGNDSEIAVYRNAYTFVDLEMNAENSILFVNGSYVGLTSGRYGITPHDNLSAIVNSATIHNLLSEGSKRSRVVVGGDVVIPGGTMRIDPSNGNAIGQIEDASAAWWSHSRGNAPFYRIIDNYQSLPESYNLELISRYRFPNQTTDYLGGFSNLFQVPNMRVNVNNLGLSFNRNFYQNGFLQTEITPVINNIRGHHVTSDYNAMRRDSINQISGAWSYSLAANGILYNNQSNTAGGMLAGLNERLLYLGNGSYVLDNIFNGGNQLKYNNNYWDWIDGDDTTLGIPYKEAVFNQLEDLRNDLYDRAEPFIRRQYGSSKEWRTEERDGVHGLEPTLFNEIMRLIQTHPRFNTSPYVVNNSNPLLTNGAVINNIISEPNEYYLVYNNNPNINLIVNGTFNGIIFSTGTVILEGGADIKGSIITAGGGTIGTNGFEPRAMRGIEITDENDDPINGGTRAALDNGRYAGVIFRPNTSGATQNITVDFYLGLDVDTVLSNAGYAGQYEMINKAARINLLNRIKRTDGQGINLENIF